MRYNIDIIENNEKCPCGSGMNFDKCCKFNMENIKKNYISDFRNDNHINDFVRKRYRGENVSVCLHPNHKECSSKIINAHALQNNKVLSRLAVNQHVFVVSHKFEIKKTRNVFRFTEEYINNELLNSSEAFVNQFKAKLNQLKDKSELEKYYGKIIEYELEEAFLKYDIEKKGKNEATIFTGFCKYHDSSLFSPIEDHDYIQEIRQDFLYAYRAFAQEYHEKLRLIKSYRNDFKNNPHLYKDISFVLDYRYMQIDEEYMNDLKEKFDEAILNGKYDILETVHIILPKSCDFAVTAMVCIELDLEGNLLNNRYLLDTHNCKSLYLTVFPTESETVVLLSWMKEDSTHFKTYKKQILNLDRYKLKCYLNNIIPAYTPNIVLSPRLWGKQSGGGQNEFRKAFEKGNEITQYSQASPIKLFEKRKKALKSYDKFLKNTQYNLFK